MLRRVLIVALFFGIIGCASSNTNNTAGTSSETKASGANAQSIPASSQFSKISLDMGKTQVFDLIGRGNDFSIKKTGKGYIPFYAGSDRVRTVYYYKGEGRLEFNSIQKLVNIEYDPSEDGYQ